MLILKCTQKVLKELAVKKEDLPDVVEAIFPLSNWHVNLIKFGRYRALLFANDETLYSFVITGFKKKDLADIAQLFRAHFRSNLEAEGFEQAVIEGALSRHQEVILAKTDSRSVLGSMNDLTKMYQFQVERAGGAKICNMAQIIQLINRTPQLKREGAYSIVMLKTVLGEMRGE